MITCEPLTGALGAEVHGVQLADVDEATFDELRKAFLDHKVLVFRDQELSVEEHIAFGRRWGELEVHPFAPDNGHREIVKIHSTAERPYAAAKWHSDVTWRLEPSLGSILRGRIIPPVGGDTCFANAEAAYESLSDAWKERIEGLVAVHDFTHVFGGRLSPEELARKQAEHPPARHPVVRTHPETGARAIYTNRSFTTHIEGVSPDESAEILDHLERAIMSPDVQCRVRWRVDTVVMWDNRCTQHYATRDFWPAERLVERVTIQGDRPF
ncbi:MAG: taurine dioxygenase [Actinomyces sp.]|nr:MAG: taurine dioxygenase [Actinomyces sp.]